MLKRYALNFPADFLSSIRNAPGFDEQAFLRAHEIPAATSIRLNPKKQAAVELPFDTRVPWSSQGYYLTDRPSFTLDPLFHAGAYYVQEASSMFVEEALKQTVDLVQPLRVLDMCAAPGGKSTLIQSLLSDESVLVSNEVINSRLNILEENMTKWGAVNSIVTNASSKDWGKLISYFDVIVTDVPCSGSGLFRKDEAAMKEWSLDNVNMCANRQENILEELLPALKPGGILIYSTCSYSVEEDESMSDYIQNLGMSSIRLRLNEEWNIVESETDNHAFGYRFYPNQVKGEGFYLSVFQKEGEMISKHQKSSSVKAVNTSVKQLVDQYISTGDLVLQMWNDDILLMNRMMANDIAMIQKTAYIKKAGVNVGMLAKQKLVPHHALAMCTLIKDDVPSVDVTLEVALEYLRGHVWDISITDWCLVRYKGLPLGWVKGMQNRMNNYYPKNWRILHK